MLLKIQDCFAYTFNKLKSSQAKGLLIYTDDSENSKNLTTTCKENINHKKLDPLEIIDLACGASICGRPTLTILNSKDKETEIILNILDIAKSLNETSFQNITILINQDFSHLNIELINDLYDTSKYQIFLPSNPYDFCSLIKISLEATKPVFLLISSDIFEVEGPIPNFENEPAFEIASQIRKQGNDISLIATGEDIFQTCDYANNISLNAEIIETKMISPIDYHTLTDSIKKTKSAKIIQTNSFLANFNELLCKELKMICKDANISIEKIECFDEQEEIIRQENNTNFLIE